jgi:hypothetical protein
MRAIDWVFESECNSNRNYRIQHYHNPGIVTLTVSHAGRIVYGCVKNLAALPPLFSVSHALTHKQLEASSITSKFHWHGYLFVAYSVNFVLFYLNSLIFTESSMAALCSLVEGLVILASLLGCLILVPISRSNRMFKLATDRFNANANSSRIVPFNPVLHCRNFN